MGKFGKWIGGGLGWAFGGPIGALLGFAIGSMFDNAEQVDYSYGGNIPKSGRTQRGDFGVSLLILAAAVVKADGKVLKSELAYVKKFFEQQFGKRDTVQHMLLFRELLKQTSATSTSCFNSSLNSNIC
jgi:DnaJ like chaperone protein